MYKLSVLITLTILFLNMALACENDIPETLRKNTYQNPIVARSLPDPAIIKAEDGFFYLYATEDIRNMPIFKSNNLVDWEFAGTAFNAESRPDFEPKGGLWAPDINYIDGQYVLYYSMFASIGSCCEGVNSTYNTVVGRADNLFGPYLDKTDLDMMNNHHVSLIKGNDRFVGTGHNSEVVTDDNGKQWIFYHAVDKMNPKGRVLMMDELQWKDGWPYINDGTPSLEWDRPTFK